MSQPKHWFDRLADRMPGWPLWPSEQFIIALTLIGLFAYAYVNSDDDETMKGALIAAFAGAWGYYLGSSNSSQRGQQQADNAVALAHDAVKALPPPPEPDVVLAPGETAQARPAETGKDEK